MAGNDRDTSKSLYFEIFPSIHEDELIKRKEQKSGQLSIFPICAKEDKAKRIRENM